VQVPQHRKELLLGSVIMQLSITNNLESVEREWRCFERRAECTPFQTFDWISAYQRCIGGPARVKPAIVVGRQDNGELLFILPLSIERVRFSRRCAFLGHALCDYNAPLLAPEFPGKVPPTGFANWARAIENFVRKTPGYNYDLVWLDKMPERVGQQQNPLLALATRFNANRGYRACLGDNWESFYAAKRSAETRSTDRRKQRRLADNGELRIIGLKNPEERQSALRVIFDQKGRFFSRNGILNPFEKPGRANFYLSVAAKADTLVHISRLDVGSICLAANLGLQFRGCYYYVLNSYDDGPLSRYAPGRIHLLSVMRYAISQGLKYFDFTIGDHPYKLEWADEQARLYDRITVTSLRGLADAARIILTPHAKQLLKRSQLLWQQASSFKIVPGRLKSLIRWRQIG
jgi:CelD/BcsL family acetyltransferase involved in cellulose biosynthesis